MSCSSIPVYDAEQVKTLSDFNHTCNNQCRIAEPNFEESLTTELDADTRETEPKTPEIPNNSDESTELKTVIVPACPCNKQSDKYMIQCKTCQGWTHYACTDLPTYQLYILVTTSRKYTCKQCVNVPTDTK